MVETQNEKLLAALVNSWLAHDGKPEMKPAKPALPPTPCEAVTLFSALMESQIAPLCLQRVRERTPFQELLIVTIKRFQLEFWVALMRKESQKPPSIAQVTKEPLSLNPRATLENNMKPYYLCSCQQHVREFADIKVDLGAADESGRSMWDFTLGSSPLNQTLLDTNATPPAFAVAIRSGAYADLIGNIVYRLYRRGFRPTEEDRLAAYRASYHDVALFFKLLLGSTEPIPSPRFALMTFFLPEVSERAMLCPNSIPSALNGAKFSGRTQDGRVWLDFLLKSNGSYSASYVATAYGKSFSAYDWPEHINWEGKWRTLTTTNQALPHLIEFSVPPEVNASDKVVGFVPRQAFYFIPYLATQGRDTKLLQIQPTRLDHPTADDLAEALLEPKGKVAIVYQ